MFDDIFVALPEPASEERVDPEPAIVEDGGNTVDRETIADEVAVTAHIPVADLTPLLMGWLARSTRLAEEHQLPEIAGTMAALHGRLSLPGFRLAVVGEFSVGKSHLVNQLLGTEVVPTGDRPVTAAPIVISPAATTRIHVRTPDGRRASRALTPDSWKDLVAAAGGHASCQVHVDLDNQWLRHLDIELIDTPGYNETALNAAETVATVLAHSDAALMVVSATQPLGMSEREFLSDAVAAKGVPQVAIVVSRLDLVDDAGRVDIPDHIGAVAAGIAPDIRVLPGPGHPADDKRTQAIRGVVASFAESRHRAAWRSRQIAAQLADELTGLVALAAEGRAVAALDAAERQVALEKAGAELAEETKTWDRTSIELDRRRSALTGAVRARLEECRDDLVERCLIALSTAADPKAYWERDLPYTVRRDLTTIARGLDDKIGATVAVDVAWADGVMSKSFRQRVTGPAAVHERLEAPAGAGQPHLDLRDLNKTRILTRIGAPAAFVGASIVFPPLAAISALVPGFGLLFFAGGGVVAEEAYYKQRLAQERDKVRRHVRTLVDDSIDAYVRAVDGRIKRLYAEVIEQLADRRRSWYTARAAALAEPASPDRRTDWDELERAASAVHADVTSALDPPPDAATRPPEAIPELVPVRRVLTFDAS